jgi:hypothetical protein
MVVICGQQDVWNKSRSCPLLPACSR